MVSKISVSARARTGFHGDADERCEADLTEEPGKTGSAPGAKAEVLPFPRKKEGKTGSEDFEPSDITSSEGTYVEPEQVSPSSRSYPSDQRTVQFMEIMKMHFLDSILDDLEKIQPYASSIDAAVYINRVLHGIRQMEEHSPEDPFFNVLSAFYDALAFNNKWTNYTADQYLKVKAVLKKYSERSALDQKTIEKAINELEDIGFDTTPFTFDLETIEE